MKSSKVVPLLGLSINKLYWGAVFRLDDRAVCAIQGLIVGIIVTYEPHTGMTAFAPPRFLKMVRPVDDRIFIIYPVSP
jgi:hypothetical protein